VSGLTGLSGQFYVSNNPNLTQILNPTYHSTSVSTLGYSISNCNLTGTLDISNFSILNALNASGNANLTQILNPTTNSEVNLYHAYNCNLTGTLDVSGLSGLGTDFRAYGNINLTNIINPASAIDFNIYYVYGCSIGVLNWQTLTGTFNYIQIHDNAMTAAEADENIVLIDTYINLVTSLNIGGNNADLTDGSVTGFDGLSAISSLISEGVTVIS
jgi:hypothetical protein